MNFSNKDYPLAWLSKCLNVDLAALSQIGYLVGLCLYQCGYVRLPFRLDYLDKAPQRH